MAGTQIRVSNPPSMKIKLYLAIFAFAFTVIYLGMDNLIVEHPEVKLAEHDQLIMYSLTNCSSCAKKLVTPIVGQISEA